MLRHIAASCFVLTGLCASHAWADVVTLSPDKDNTLYETPAGDLSNGGGEALFAGRSSEGAGWDIKRGLLRFDIAAAIPPGAVVNSVELTLHVSLVIDPAVQPVALHAVTAEWGEGASVAVGDEIAGALALVDDASWLCRFSDGAGGCAVAWGLAGGEFLSASATQNVGDVGVYAWSSTPELVADVQAWLDAPTANHGWVLVGNESAPSTLKRFASRESLAGTSPSLVIDYTPAACPDVDVDGYEDIACGGLDCDDADPDIHPGHAESCDGKDNDCDPSSADGLDEAWLAQPCDGADADLCDEGVFACVSGAQTCSDTTSDNVETCDTLDNDCDPATADGAGEAWLALPCDGVDADLCDEGVFACVAGAQSCSDTTSDNAEICDTLDNDCDPATADGVDEAWLAQPCDGADADLCAEGDQQCVSGAQSCSDTTGDNVELCDGADNDCNPATADGASETWLGQACDGADSDLCEEGALICATGSQACSDATSDSVEVCDGLDNDCDGTIDEGVKITFYQDADGDTWGAGGITVLACSAPPSYVITDGDCDDSDAQRFPGSAETCDGKDNDCNSSTADGTAESWFGQACDGPDSDLCDEGTEQCVAGVQGCSDATADNRELCDGIDNDCDPTTADGQHEGWYGLACDGADADLCEEGVSQCVASAQQCSDSTADSVEICDTLDNDCDGAVDEDVTTTFFLDSDGDTWGNGTATLEACSVPDGYVATSGDCDDSDAQRYPGNAETCDGKDDDCDDTTADGAAETWFGQACDGPDSDLCAEGAEQCVSGAKSCSDASADNLEVCDAVDNDCNPATLDGASESWLGLVCDGADADLCDEGVLGCSAGSQACSDQTGDSVEICDGLDNDCDGTADEGVTAIVYRDVDGDGWGDDTNTLAACSPPQGYVAIAGDCEDTDNQRFPGNGEACDNQDNDCDDSSVDGADEGWFAQPCDGSDTDLCPEGISQCLGGVQSCSDVSGDNPELCDATDNDCDSSTADGVHEGWYGQPCDGADTDLCVEGVLQCTSGAQSCSDTTTNTVEVCDGVDNDCDGQTDEDVLTSYYPDADHDGWGNGAVTMRACTQPVGTVASAGDCDDSDAASFPGNNELCDGKDNDCNGAVDDTIDADGDGYNSCQDCDDQDTASHPGGQETCDKRDNDCDGQVDNVPDGDGDGFGACFDCIDSDPESYPGASERCDGVDNNCDSLVDNAVDLDGDGFNACQDCDDAAAATHPGAPEQCNGADNDCDGVPDVSSLTKAGTTGPIPDNTATVYPLAIAASGDVFDLDVQVDVEHTWLADLRILLTSPSGTSIVLTANHGGGSDAYHNTVFDDEASSSIMLASAPFEGRYRPVSPLSIFDGEPLAGTWTLRIEDVALGDVGMLLAWSIMATYGSDSDADGYSTCFDCNDLSSITHPGATEVCDGQDNDCNGLDDFGAPGVAGAETDSDGDGFSECDGDCDDDDGANFPGNGEVCDGRDNDCNGLDDFGAPGVAGSETDSDGDGLSKCDGDCDDGDGANFPGHAEVCDGQDNDCNGLDDFGAPGVAGRERDDDGDGLSECGGDCDDSNPAIHPSAVELCDGRDNDCDGLLPMAELDVDGDQVMVCEGDCDDADPLVYPGASERCNGVDDDCDLLLPPAEFDGDDDGVAACEGDCDDDEATIFPGAHELVCDNVDQDCNGTDEGPSYDTSLGNVVGMDLRTNTTCGRGDDFGASEGMAVSCGSPQNGEDVAFHWSAPATGTYVFGTAGSSVAVALSLREVGCPNDEIACSTFQPKQQTQPNIRATLNRHEQVVIVIDAADEGVCGDYVLSIVDCTDDTDEDGLFDCEEEALGTNPAGVDSDGDTISDFDEVGGDYTKPFDSDADGLIDALDEDSDGDGAPDREEAGDEDVATWPIDTDRDGLPDYRDEDSDGDMVSDQDDNCRLVVNPTQDDRDGDGTGDVCAGDSDGDGVLNVDDGCPWTFDPNQTDTDGDGLGDACDGDIDNDNVPNESDNCPMVPNRDQFDPNDDGLGYACDEDYDGDTIPDGVDNCPRAMNADQRDSDGDGIGEACEDDADGDGVPNLTDNCVRVANRDQADDDGDGVGNACEGVVVVDDASTDTYPTEGSRVIDDTDCTCHVVGGGRSGSAPVAPCGIVLALLCGAFVWRRVGRDKSRPYPCGRVGRDSSRPARPAGARCPLSEPSHGR